MYVSRDAVGLQDAGVNPSRLPSGIASLNSHPLFTSPALSRITQSPLRLALQETLDVHQGQVWCVRARGPVLMTAATDGAMYISDLRASSRPVMGVVAAHEDAVAGLQFDDFKAVTSSFDSTIRIWELRTFRGRRVEPSADVQHVREMRPAPAPWNIFGPPDLGMHLDPRTLECIWTRLSLS